jgi:hypothetical protein
VKNIAKPPKAEIAMSLAPSLSRLEDTSSEKKHSKFDKREIAMFSALHPEAKMSENR